MSGSSSRLCESIAQCLSFHPILCPTHILCMLSGHMLLSSLKMYFFTLRHRPPPVFPMSHPSSNQHLRPFPLRALIPFHLFLIDTLYFSGRQLRPGSKNTSTQVQQSNTVVVLLSCEGGGFCTNCVWHLFSFWSGWPSIRTAVHVPPGCLSPWQQESGRSQQEDGGKIEWRLRRNTRCSVSVNILNIPH